MGNLPINLVMNTHSSLIYEFDRFDLDVECHALYHDGVLVDIGGKKTVQVLSVLLSNANRLVSHQQLIDEVWGGEAFGVRPDNVNHYVSKIRAALAEYEPDRTHIESVKGRGYVFNGAVKTRNAFDNSTEKVAPDLKRRKPWRVSSTFLITGFILVFIVAIAFWSWFRSDNADEIRKVVKDSQLYESLVLYKNPSAVRDEDLNKYWTGNLEISGNYDRRRILDAVKKLIDEGRYYGDETRCEQFEFQSVELNKNGDFAVVRTLEKWFIADYSNDGTLLKNKYVGPYFVSYTLRSVNGRWLVEKSTTARMNRPRPSLDDIEVVTEVKAGEQFRARVTGNEFEVETIFFTVIGPGCPEIKPCKVPNSALRENARLSSSVLEDVPFTLTQGTFRIFAHNGDSLASDPVLLIIP